MGERAFRIQGMDCAEEIAVLKREVGPVVQGEEHLFFDLLKGKMTVGSGAGAVASERIISAVNGTGMSADVWREETGAPQSFGKRHGRAMLSAASGLCILGGCLFHAWQAQSWLAAWGVHEAGAAAAVPLFSKVAYILGILCGSWHVWPKAWLAARRFRPDMNLLMALAVAGAAFLGQWFEAASVAFLFAFSLLLESWSVGRARRAIHSLMDLTPPRVRLKRKDGQEEEVPPGQVAVGSLFIVKPGERIALDGRVASGASEVNQAPITGESLPVSKAKGDGVFAGSINGPGALEVESTKPAGETTLARTIRLVEQAQALRARVEQWVERFARVYTPSVMALALLIFVIPPFLLGGSWADWFYRALVLLVIACPCALVISTPVSVVAALASAARNGVLIKGGLCLEAPARLKAMAFDKTGTLTQGEAAVTEVVPLNGHDERALLERAAALEARSEHTLGRAILEYARARNVPVRAAEAFESLQGKGARGRFQGRPFWVGSHRYLEERGQETEAIHQKLETLSEAGRSVVVVGNESHVCGFIAIADRVRPEARAAIAALRREGIRPIVMLTGDNDGTARAIARETGVDEVRSELLPEDKLKALEALVAKYGQTAMVGDGVNDAPALARSSLGIAVGAAASDAAIETADVAMLSGDLFKLPWLVRHSRRTLRIIRQNISAALGVKALFVLLTFAGYAFLWMAIAADMGVSLLVIFNGLRLLQVR